MQRFMGIDGGGSNLRVVIVDESMNQLALVRSTTANPNIIGYDVSKTLIQNTLRQALQKLKIETVDAVGIGIAGAPATRSRDWLETVVREVLPDTHIVASADDEIALVGTFAQREGILILAGTGSIAYGINREGERLQLGGWGYMLGDEGSGYWLGLQALHLLTQYLDKPSKSSSSIVDKLLLVPELSKRDTLIRWLYQDRDASVAKVARLAHYVLEAAEEGDVQAVSIVKSGAAYLLQLVETIRQRLRMPEAHIALAGSLLTNDTMLSRELMAALLMSQRPVPLYEAVVGAALLAKLDFEEHKLKVTKKSK